MEQIPFDLLRILAMVDETDVCHYWFLRDKLVSPMYRSEYHCRSIGMEQYDEAGKKLLNWVSQDYLRVDDTSGLYSLTWKGLWTLHVGLTIYGVDAIFADYY